MPHHANAATCRRVFLRVALPCALALGTGPLQAATGFTVAAVARGQAVDVDARATVHAPHAVVWSTLTDYDRLAQFVRGLRRSHVDRRSGATAIVSQQGQADFLLFSFPVDVVVASTELPPDRIDITRLDGNLRRLDGRYRIEPGTVSGTQVLRWTGLVEPGWTVPAFIRVPAIRDSIEVQFRSMVEEIERRASAQPAPAEERP